MGRGRAKAKQTKVARELKYNSGNTDFNALQAELASAAPADEDPDSDLGENDPYAKYYDEDDDSDESDD
jgi:hypothetical protein